MKIFIHVSCGFIILTTTIMFGACYASEPVFVTELPSKQVTKLEAMRQLIVSNNKTTIYKCQAQEVSDKGTVKNKKESK